MTWKQLTAELKYKDWVNEDPGVWRQLIPNGEIAVKKTGNMVTVWNFGSSNPQSDKHGYLDGVIVEPRHVLEIVNMINEVKSPK